MASMTTETVHVLRLSQDERDAIADLLRQAITSTVLDAVCEALGVASRMPAIGSQIRVLDSGEIRRVTRQDRSDSSFVAEADDARPGDWDWFWLSDEGDAWARVSEEDD